MKNVTFILFALVIVGVTKAQNNNQKDSLTYRINADINEVKKVLKKDTVGISLFTDSTQSVYMKIDPSIRINREPLEIKGYILTESEVVSQLPKEKWNPEIDKFLNIEDTTIFGSKFKHYQLQEVHPSRRNHYQVVEKIHDLSENLQNIEYELSDSSIEKLANATGNTKEAIKAINRETAKKQLKSVENLLNEMENLDINVLSPVQQSEYSRLKDEYNSLVDELYSE